MKLLYISNTRFPSERAHTTQIAHMCEAFVQNGVDTTLVVNNRSAETNINFLGFNPSFLLLKIPFGFFFVPYSKFFFIINNIYFTSCLLRRVDLKKFDVLYVRDEWLCLLISFFVPIRKIVYESHEAKYNLAARTILKRGVKCVCISEGIYNFYFKKNIPQEQMLVAHDGIDASFFEVSISKEEARKKLGLNIDSKIAMYIGGFDAWKGIETFCAASEGVDDLLFVAIGGSLNEIKGYKKLYPAVHFLGQKPYSDLKYNQRAADVLVIPNTAKTELSAQYTSPLKLFAHMTSGVPLVVSDVPSLTSVLSKGLATYFSPDNPQDLADSVKECIMNLESSNVKAEKAALKAVEYQWRARAKKIISYIS